MGVKLDWQFGEVGSDSLDRGASQARARPGFAPLPAYSGLEKHPEMMRLRSAARPASAKYAGDFYLKMCFIVAGFLLGMYLLV